MDGDCFDERSVTLQTRCLDARHHDYTFLYAHTRCFVCVDAHSVCHSTQLPFFFIGAYGVYTGAAWLKIPGIMYGESRCRCGFVVSRSVWLEYYS